MAVEENVKTKWAILGKEQKDGIKKYIVGLVVSIAENPEVVRLHKNILSKGNSILVQIVKQEWDNVWPSAVKDLAEACGQSQALCENNLEILIMLSEEIFEDTKQTMVSAQLNRLKLKYCDNVKIIYDLCEKIGKMYIQDPSKISPSLIKVCVKALYSFLSWAPASYIFMTDLLDGILIGLLPDPKLTVQVLQCCTDCFNISLNDFNAADMNTSKAKIFNALQLLVARLVQIFPNNRRFREERIEKLKNHNQLTLFDNATKEIALMFTALFRQHWDWLFAAALNLYRENNRQHLDICANLEIIIKYMVSFSEVDNDPLYKICLDFWQMFTSKKVEMDIKLKAEKNIPGGLNLNNTSYDIQELFMKVFPSESFNTQVRTIIRKMPRPQEVLIETDEHGIPKKITVENTDNTHMFTVAQNVLSNLAKMNWESVSMIIYSLINQQNHSENFSVELINSLSWAVGALNGTLNEEDEKKCLSLILRNLLNLNDIKVHQKDKIIVVSNILYISGQFPRTLNASWALLSVLIDKAGEFMEYEFPGLSEMSCNTFLRICQNCKDQIVKNHTKAAVADPIKKALDPAVWDIFSNISTKIGKLTLPNKLIYYEAIGELLSAVTDEKVLTEAVRIALNSLISSWKNFIASVDVNPEILKKDETLLNISFFINVNEKLNSCLKDRYNMVFDVIFNEMVIIYGFYTKTCQDEFAKNKSCLTFYSFKKMRAVRRDVLKMFTTFIEFTKDKQSAAQKYMPSLFTILKAYKEEPKQLREPELILLFSKVLQVLGSVLGDYVPSILDCIFGGTLEMISTDFSSFPDHRVNFFVFLKKAVEQCFEALLNIPKDQLEIVINCMIWSIKHELTSIYEVGLESVLALIQKVNSNLQLANNFYKVYYFKLFNDVLYVLIDKLHSNGYSLQMQILRTLITVLDYLSVPLNEQEPDNKKCVMLTVYNQMKEGFPNLSAEDHQRNIQTLFTNYREEDQFSSDLKDYLVQLELYTQGSGTN